MVVETATARSMTAGDGAAVELATVEGRDPRRPGGKRFGALVHAALAEVELRAGREEIARVAAAQGRLTGATDEEVAAAARAVEAALRHPLLLAAATSADCRREEPLIHRLRDGTVLAGGADLACRHVDNRTDVDFKTAPPPR